LTEFQRELDVNYCHLAAISTDAPEVSGAFRAGLGATFAFLSDHERRAVTELDIVDETDPVHPRIAYPYSFSVGPDLVAAGVGALCPKSLLRNSRTFGLPQASNAKASSGRRCGFRSAATGLRRPALTPARRAVTNLRLHRFHPSRPHR
jgi:hypothetical protein